jgi:hypothetical protein
MPVTKNPIPLPCPLLRRFAAVICLVAAALATRADIAVLREKGPHSGSAFSNPGLIADAPAGLTVAMKTADVKIHLRPGDGDTLKADVTADFELEDSSPAELNGQLYLVGFPVTGLSSKIVTIDNFAVKVDGQAPAMVLRQWITISRRQAKLVDQRLIGEFESEFAPEAEQSRRSLHYPDADNYRASYIWQQTSHPGAATHVRVTYTVTLHPQSMLYSKTWDTDAASGEVIPSKTLRGILVGDSYYFFDYVLRSGATWDGPIGKEVVEISAEPALKLATGKIALRNRRPPTAFFDESTEIPERERPQGIQGAERSESDPSKGSLRWTLENGDPNEDLLIIIPAAAIKGKK